MPSNDFNTAPCTLLHAPGNFLRCSIASKRVEGIVSGDLIS